MTKIAYKYTNFREETFAFIILINEIIEEYDKMNLRLTVRQLYYQLVARDIISNTQQEYGKLSTIINKGRLCGLIDWEVIEDRTRYLRELSHWEHPKNIIEDCYYNFKLDKWIGQDYRVEVWIEKDALLGIISSTCENLDIPYFSCRGYTSQSEMWIAGQRLERYIRDGQVPVIFHFGDHDPSGIDMTRDIHTRLQLFLGKVCGVQRLALNYEQIEEFKPPPNPAKTKDPRFTSYITSFGSKSWELDALEPAILQNLIRETTTKFRDEDLYQKTVNKEKEYKNQLKDIANKI